MLKIDLVVKRGEHSRRHEQRPNSVIGGAARCRFCFLGERAYAGANDRWASLGTTGSRASSRYLGSTMPISPGNFARSSQDGSGKRTLTRLAPINADGTRRQPTIEIMCRHPALVARPSLSHHQSTAG